MPIFGPERPAFSAKSDLWCPKCTYWRGGGGSPILSLSPKKRVFFSYPQIVVKRGSIYFSCTIIHSNKVLLEDGQTKMKNLPNSPTYQHVGRSELKTTLCHLLSS